MAGRRAASRLAAAGRRALDADDVALSNNLLNRALQSAADQGYHVMVAGISAANPGAVAFHAACGFEHAGRMAQVGRKWGQVAAVFGFDNSGELRRLLERLCDRLERERAGLRRLRVDFFRAEGDVRSLTVGTGRPVRDPAALFRPIAEHLDRLLDGLPSMMAPTVSPLHGNAGYALKVVVPAADIPSMLPRLKDNGGRDILVYRLEKIIP